MIDKDYLTSLDSIRSDVLNGLERLEEVGSFRKILASVESARQAHEHLRSRITPRITRPFPNEFVVAVVGSSGHGKTTVMDEMFPGLSERGWLETDVTDTTSQALRVSYAAPDDPNLDKVQVNSWSLDQISALFQDPEVQRSHEASGVNITFNDDSIELDGRSAQFAGIQSNTFKFPSKIELRPFSSSYEVPPEQQRDEKFIKALTVKQPSNQLNASPVLHVGDHPFHALQLRAVVKDVSLKDDFSRIRKWLNREEDSEGRLVFVDTPGVGVSGSVKDEVLIHALEAKSRQIVVELLKNDELDLVVHLVLCGRQSDFAPVWKALEREGGAGQMRDLAERTILAVNGTNIYFSNKDIKRHIDAGDHFEITIEDNILQKMSPQERVKPAAVCFLDSKRIVEGTGLLGMGSYEKIYKKFTEKMSEWLEEDSRPMAYLRQNGWEDTFRENIEALADPEDCGQGFLIRQIERVVQRSGKRLLVKKHLVRNGLMKIIRDLRDLLEQFYERDGTLNANATEEAIQSVFDFLRTEDKYSIEKFCVASIDEGLSGIVTQYNGDDWVLTCFEKSCTYLYRQIEKATSAPKDVLELFWNTYTASVQDWADRWGYTHSYLPPPAQTNNRTGELLLHSLKSHVREILFQYITRCGLPQELSSMPQEPEEKEQMSIILEKLKTAHTRAVAMCREQGVE